jgi:hypothetical protein
MQGFQRLLCPGCQLRYFWAYSPELLSAERLWPLVDECLVNKHFESLDDLEDVLAARCCVLQTQSQEIPNITHYHWLNWG